MRREKEEKKERKKNLAMVTSLTNELHRFFARKEVFHQIFLRGSLIFLKGKKYITKLCQIRVIKKGEINKEILKDDQSTK